MVKLERSMRRYNPFFFVIYFDLRVIYDLRFYVSCLSIYIYVVRMLLIRVNMLKQVRFFRV